MQVWKDNALILSKEASVLALARAEMLVNEFLNKLQSTNPDRFGSLNDHGLQYSIFTAQKEYARTGDKDLFGLLVELLLTRTYNVDRSHKQIVIEECLSVAPKLTGNQLDTLTVIYLVKHKPNTLSDFIAEVRPFFAMLTNDKSLFSHLEYCRCITDDTHEHSIEALVLKNFKERAPDRMNLVAERLIERGKHMKSIIEVWNTSPMSGVRLTGVGELIAETFFTSKMQYSNENSREEDPATPT